MLGITVTTRQQEFERNGGAGQQTVMKNAFGDINDS